MRICRLALRESIRNRSRETGNADRSPLTSCLPRQTSNSCHFDVEKVSNVRCAKKQYFQAQGTVAQGVLPLVGDTIISRRSGQLDEYLARRWCGKVRCCRFGDAAVAGLTHGDRKQDTFARDGTKPSFQILLTPIEHLDGVRRRYLRDLGFR
jgi:hypothetical protein